ncbi:MAG TPA: RNA 2',3'-cyclic phosphodiesterase [Clostridiales bacterium]|nr:RNA 2',3'-cyclic phosphodiesterase [Clostridiales bacterium]
MRLFIAVNFDQDAKSKISQLAERLKSLGISGNYTKEQNYHLTLLFLGESNDRQLQAAKRAIQRIKIKPFDITLKNISNFGKNIIHLKVKPCEPLNQIYNFLYESLKNDYCITNTSFSPHITLVRKPNFLPSPKADIFGDILPFSYFVDAISLMLSSRQNGKLIYTPLFTHGL